jgi:hypothetical protein
MFNPLDSRNITQRFDPRGHKHERSADPTPSRAGRLPFTSSLSAAVAPVETALALPLLLPVAAVAAVGLALFRACGYRPSTCPRRCSFNLAWAARRELRVALRVSRLCRTPRLPPTLSCRLRAAVAGGNGTGAAAGAAGTAGAIATATTAVFSNFGVPVWTIGQAGGAGGAQTGAAGGTVTWGAVGSPVSGGAGGAGCTTTEFAGGNITGASIIPTIAGGALGANPGQAGYRGEFPLATTGGSGAGSSNTVAGAAGGSGKPGSGGGGGGAGVTTGGAGGVGGDGFVIITALFS